MEPPSLIKVLLDGARSADPPTKPGIFAARAFRTRPEDARVAMPFPTSKTGRAASRSAGISRARKRSKASARPGSSALYAAYIASQASLARRSLRPSRVNQPRTSSGT